MNRDTAGVIRFRYFPVLLLASVVGWLLSCSGRTELPQEITDLQDQLPKKIDYNFHVRPILSDRCYNCHGPDEAQREADLRLDDAHYAIEDRENGAAIVPGRAHKSLVVERILSKDSEELMPPPESKLTLSDREKAILIQWINEGAEYEPHWAFVAPEKMDIPENIHPVDFFIGKKLEEHGMTFTAPASKESLIRRIYFGLTGLPPTIAEIDHFVDDLDPDAFSKVVDDLLQRPAYGERMAADWMDVARYADSDGYLDDKHRDFSPWRDWVINAFHENMPYDQFVTWQLAGDQVENPSKESILATAFNRLHRKNSEAGIVFEEYRVEYVADRVHTFGKAFMGMTLECARCHDHKYDPISQNEYYQLFGFFNQTNELGTAIYGPDQVPGPALLLSTDEQDEKINFLREKISEQEEKLSDLEFRTPVSFGELNNPDIKSILQDKLVAHHTFDEIKKIDEKKYHSINLVNKAKPAVMVEPDLRKGQKGKAFFINDYNYITLADKVGWADRMDPFAFTFWIRPERHYDEAGLLTHCEDLRLGYKGYSLHLQENKLRFIISRAWPDHSIEVLSESEVPVGRWSHIAVNYDGSSRADGIEIYLNGEICKKEIINNTLYKSVLYEPDIHTYGFHGVRLGYRDKIKTFKGGAIDEIKFFNDLLSELEIKFDYGDPDVNYKDQKLRKQFDFINHNSIAHSQRKHLHGLRSELNDFITDIKEIMVMRDRREPRPTYFLNRGRYDMPEHLVDLAVPASIAPDFSGFKKNRLGLAQWLFSEENPLTARVFVNRLWQQHFGRGLVQTTEDFGAQGALPSHPGLLDWLAREFIDSGWNVKHMHRLILTSRCYQQSALSEAESRERDPENRLLSRGPSQRLSAEMLRDNALAISGLLVDKVGGPSVYPYQPAGLWDEISNKIWRYPYLQEPGEGLYRRSLYTIWKRTAPPPSMLLFDVPDRSFCTVRRQQTNTPLQALALLNDPHYVEACCVLAMKSCENFERLEDRMHFVFKRILGRDPDDFEIVNMKKFYWNEFDILENNPKQVREYFENGEIAVPDRYNKKEVACLAALGHNILNTYEAQVMK